MVRGFTIEKDKNGRYPCMGPVFDENGNTCFPFRFIVSPNVYKRLIKYGATDIEGVKEGEGNGYRKERRQRCFVTGKEGKNNGRDITGLWD